MKAKIMYYIAAARWLWENRSWANTRQKWKAFERAMRKYETPAQRAEGEYQDYWEGRYNPNEP